MESIYEGIYRNEIVLPDTPLKVLNSYIIMSDGDALVVDTGFDFPECEAAFMSGLNKLGLKPGGIDLLITHMHADHSGLCGKLSDHVKSVSIGEMDGAVINTLTGEMAAEWHRYYNDFADKFDLTKYGVHLGDDPGHELFFKKPINFRYLEEKDNVTVGEFSFSVIDTPGHTPGHICLYDAEHKIMIAGDHVLAKITPNISFWGYGYGDSLGAYLKSLKKIRDYDVKLLLTSHRHMPESLSARVDELIEHHDIRLNEVTEILQEGEQSVNGVASRMQWYISGGVWEDFPNAQKWFAAHEAMAHLEHLRALGKVSQREKDGKLIYSLLSGTEKF